MLQFTKLTFFIIKYTHTDLKRINSTMGCNTSTGLPINGNVSKLEAQMDQDAQDAKNVDELNELNEQIDHLMRVSIITADGSIPPDSGVDHIILDIISNWDWDCDWDSHIGDEEYSSDECSECDGCKQDD